MTLHHRLTTLIALGNHLRTATDEFLEALQKRTEFNNAWFTLANQKASVKAIAEEFLAEDKLRGWVSAYAINPIAGEPFFPEPMERKTVGLVLAGNIPLVGFHDILCVFVAGHKAQIKLSSKDPYVLPYLIELLAKFDERTADYFEIVPNLKDFDAVIATGSNNSARYFETYFGKYPHIVRKNRNAVAVLTGEETEEELRALGNDVFWYFGLGCRNVSKLYVPTGYDLDPLLHIFHEWKHLQNHTKWKNNFDYNYALTTLNKESFHLTGPLMVLEEKAIPSRIGTLHFEYYTDKEVLAQELEARAGEIQLIVHRINPVLEGEVPAGLPVQGGRTASPDGDFTLQHRFKSVFVFGEAQRPGLADYADGVDTLAFLLTLPQ